MIDLDNSAETYHLNDLENFNKRLRLLQALELKFGILLDRTSWIDTTAEEIRYCEIKIAELER